MLRLVVCRKSYLFGGESGSACSLDPFMERLVPSEKDNGDCVI